MELINVVIYVYFYCIRCESIIIRKSQYNIKRFDSILDPPQ